MIIESNMFKYIECVWIKIDWIFDVKNWNIHVCVLKPSIWNFAAWMIFFILVCVREACVCEEKKERKETDERGRLGKDTQANQNKISW